MAAGIATLQRLLADDGAAYRELDRLGARLQSGLQAALDVASTGWSVVRLGSILWLSLQPGPPPRRYEEIDPAAAARYARLHAALLERGVYLAPSAYEVMFVSLAHDDAAIDQTITAFGYAVRAARD
jgi:glutamate-1-semialdehyde 2,1-aminomutase